MPESTQQKHINSIVHVIWSEADDMTVDSNNRVSILEWVSKKITTCQIVCLYVVRLNSIISNPGVAVPND